MQLGNDNNTSEIVQVQKGSFRAQTATRKSVSNALVSANSKFRKILCPQCEDCHLLNQCPRIPKLTVEQRWSLVRKKRLCINCLRLNHFVSKCLFTDRCKICQGKHHTILHEEERKSAVHIQVFLSTALINVRTGAGNSVACRAMLDSGSRRSLITESCWKKLGLKGRPTVHRIRGINNLVAETSFQEVGLEFTPHFDSEIFKVDALIVNRITSNLPNFRVNLQAWPHLEGLKLADLEFYISSSVEILIGADL
ncbi:hypothetical protein AVEN_247264-1 [Araneus ventricosus]|uniref:Uncharacterized protein n=1 Tax=Araneus ventricosus TaxID=182803 RepID=A0A4Y2UF08_ARAVE|nr:hypothetical protein AVEN_247264-1 [Araneus ventricosus]